MQYLKDQPPPPLKSLIWWKYNGDKLVVQSCVLTEASNYMAYRGRQHQLTHWYPKSVISLSAKLIDQLSKSKKDQWLAETNTRFFTIQN
jgi:hypothetical protein